MLKPSKPTEVLATSGSFCLLVTPDLRVAVEVVDAQVFLIP